MIAEEWNKIYMESIDSMKERIPRVRGVLTAYNTNIDAIVHVDGAKIKRSLRENPEIGKNVAVNLKYPPREIIEETDVVAGLLRCMKNGTSEEWIIRKRSIRMDGTEHKLE